MKEMMERGVQFLDLCIIDPAALHETQIPPLASILSNFIGSADLEDDFRMICLKIAKRCCVSHSFCDHFLQYLSQIETAKLLNTQNIPIKHKLIDLLVEVFSEEKRTAYLTSNLSMAIMTSFSSSFHNQTSQLWLKVLLLLLKASPGFRKEFMRFGGLKVILNLLKIPHMDIVFQSVRVLKTLAAHGIIKEAQYGNSTRQQLIHLLGGAKYEYEQRQLADHSAKRALEIAKKEAATTLKIPLPKPVKVAPSQGMILEKMQKEAEEKAKLELATKATAKAELKRQEIQKRLDDNQKRAKQKDTKTKNLSTSSTSKNPKGKKKAENPKQAPSKSLSQPVKEKVTAAIKIPPIVFNEEVLSEDEKDSEDLNTRKSKINSILESIAACSMEQFNNYGLLLALQKLVIQKSIF